MGERHTGRSRGGKPYLGGNIWQATASPAQEPCLALVSEHGAQSKVGDLEVPIGCQEQVLGLHISMCNAL